MAADLAFTTTRRHRWMSGSFLCILELYGGCCCFLWWLYNLLVVGFVQTQDRKLSITERSMSLR